MQLTDKPTSVIIEEWNKNLEGLAQTIQNIGDKFTKEIDYI